MKKILRLNIIIAIVLTVMASCGDKKSDSAAEILAGSTSKTWEIAKQLDSHGDKEKLTEAEEDGKINLYADGRFSIVEDKGTATGKWNVENEKTLVMHFDGQAVTENFTIQDIENNCKYCKGSLGISCVG